MWLATDAIGGRSELVTGAHPRCHLPHDGVEGVLPATVYIPSVELLD